MTQAVTKRLRRWVAPSDDEDSSLPYHLDEQEQTQLIANLRTQNTHSNDQFKTYFAILSLIPTLLYIVYPSRTSILAITALALTAYTAYFLPLKQNLLPFNEDDGPLRFLPVLNGALAIVVILDELVKGGDGVWTGSVPLVMWIALWIARTWANGIDLESLEKLKYNVLLSSGFC